METVISEHIILNKISEEEKRLICSGWSFYLLEDEPAKRKGHTRDKVKQQNNRRQTRVLSVRVQKQTNERLYHTGISGCSI